MSAGLIGGSAACSSPARLPATSSNIAGLAYSISDLAFGSVGQTDLAKLHPSLKVEMDLLISSPDILRLLATIRQQLSLIPGKKRPTDDMSAYTPFSEPQPGMSTAKTQAQSPNIRLSAFPRHKK